MTNPELQNYVKQNLTAGFSETEIKQALLEVGWQETEITEAFAESKNGLLPPTVKQFPPKSPETHESPNRLISTLLVLIALPVLAFGGFWAYQKLQKGKPVAETPSESQAPPNEEVRGTITETEGVLARDLERLRAVEKLQIALDYFFQIKKFYPQKLTELEEEGFLPKLPVDPQTQKYYLYSPLGNPALHYSLSFLLENRLGVLENGLQVAGPEIRWSAKLLQKQEDLIRSETPVAATAALQITDLSQTSFSPGQEVNLDIQPAISLELEAVRLIVGGLDLLDKAQPFNLSFSAPQEPGNYEVRVFAFDREGAGYFQMTSLSVNRP